MAKIARARIVPPEQLSLVETASQTVARVIQPGTSTERYSRTWRIGLTSVSHEEDVLYSRIGFERPKGTFLWDEESKDFQPAPTPSGQVVPFAVDLRDLAVAFQTRPPDIKINSFTGALQTLLREQTNDTGWSVETRIQRLTFDEWRSTVDKVIRVYFRAERPNPNWEGRPDLENIFEGLGNLDLAEFDFQAEDGIDTSAALVRQLLDHAERGYGRGGAVGTRQVGGETVESHMDTEHGEAEEWTLPDAQAGEVPPDSLRDELRRPDSS